jgi:hypothetical protein
VTRYDHGYEQAGGENEVHGRSDHGADRHPERVGVLPGERGEPADVLPAPARTSAEGQIYEEHPRELTGILLLKFLR